MTSFFFFFFFFFFSHYNFSFRASRKTKSIVFVFNKHVLHFESKLDDVIIATCFFEAICIENVEMTKMNKLRK